MTSHPHALPHLQKNLIVKGKEYSYFSLREASVYFKKDISHLPFTLRILLENLLRNLDEKTVKQEDILSVMEGTAKRATQSEIAFRPSRVLMQDFTGVPAVVDLASMREAVIALKGDPKRVNPLTPVDLVIDHSVQVDYSGTKEAFDLNVDREMERNLERYMFLRWGQETFDNFRVVPPGTGICHQVNLEYLAQVVWTQEKNGKTIAYPDTVVGTDSHTTMINGLSVLGWGVGGIEAEAAMLGQPISMLVPDVIGFKMTGHLPEGATATDLVLTVTQMLRKKGVVNKFVEFYGEGIQYLSLSDRATLANMAPEYGATCGFFPVDEKTIAYLRLTSRKEERIALVEAYAKEQGLWWEKGNADPVYTDTLELDLKTIEPCLAGPKRPQDRVVLKNVPASFHEALPSLLPKKAPHIETSAEIKAPVENMHYTLSHGSLVLAAITSCTNTSNPGVMLAAGLVARKARSKGLHVKPWVKTSLAPGSQVVTEYYNASKLNEDLDALGFNIVGYGCTTCIGNSGPLAPAISTAIKENDLVVAAVLSGNRNFEGRIHPHIKANYLASPPLVVAYALLGRIDEDITTTSLGKDTSGKEVYLKDIWPTNQEIADVVAQSVRPEMFEKRYANVFLGEKSWQDIQVNASSLTYEWNPFSTYVKHPPYFEQISPVPTPPKDIINAQALAILGDSITTDHISPAGDIAKTSPAAAYLREQGIADTEFNSYGARRGNHEVMMRGTFANIRLQNEMVPGIEGGMTLHAGSVMSIFDAAMLYKQEKTPLIVIAGKEYGTGSSRDWAAKGTSLLGVRALIAESFERIHRSNLIGMGVLPFIFEAGVTRKTLGIEGNEYFTIIGLTQDLQPNMHFTCCMTRKNGSKVDFTLRSCLDTEEEVNYYMQGGILQKVVRDLALAKDESK